MPIDYETEPVHRSSYTIPQSLYRQMKVVIAKKNISFTEAFNEAIRDYIEKYERNKE